MTFTVIDKKTGKEADDYAIALHEDWAKSLCYCDMDGFAIMQDGYLILIDECGRFEYCPDDRFEVLFDNERPQDNITEEDIQNAIKAGYENGYSMAQAKYQRPQGKWTPTSEFSPEEYDSYLVMWRFRSGEYDGKLFYEICEYYPDEDEWERIEQAGEAGAEIVAWMPLPERYEPKQDDDTAKDMI